MSLNDPQWGNRGSGNDSGGGGKRPNQGPPDLEEMWSDLNERLSDMFGKRGGRRGGSPDGGDRPPVEINPKFLGGGIGLLIAIVLLLWLSSGFYIVDASQRGLVLQFGRYKESTESGLRWLLALQNRDGGLPTFCRGWGRLPFDRSCPDLTAHAIAAMQAWHADVSPTLRRRLTRAMKRAIGYLARSQRSDGSWVPLWFGNEWVDGGENRTYGTAKAVLGLVRLRGGPLDARVAPMLAAGARWLECNVNDDGGWGGGPGAPSTVEETALAVQALAIATEAPSSLIAGGLDWIARHRPVDGDAEAAPIGLYFASLWYWERLYPLIYATAAFRLSDRSCQ